MRLTLAAIGLAGLTLIACSPAPDSTPTQVVPAPDAAQPETEEPVTELPPVKIGPYEVTANYEGLLAEGHFNFHVAGPDFVGIRQWVGPEDAVGVLVSRAEVLSDHIHAGVEMPNPIPPNPRLWIEIETPEGERLKGSIQLH